MTVQDHLRVLKDRWLAIVVSILITMLAAAGVFLIQPPQYTANLQMYVSSPLAQAPDTVLSASQIAQNRAKSFTELATSYRVASTVVGRLGLDVTPEDLQSRIEASNATDSVVIDLSVTDGSPQRAAAIANSVGVALQETVGDVERPQVFGAASPVEVRAVQPAPIPTEPSSASLKRLLGIGFLVGVAVGVAVAFARNALDNTIKTVDDLRQVAGAPTLGSVAYNSQMSKRPLIVHDDPQNPRAEDFRKLRTNLQFVDVGNPHKILTVTSAVPGEGKTTTTVNLAIALATAGNRVLLIEADLRRPKAADLLGLDGSVGVTSVLAQRTSLAQAIQVWDEGPFDVLASGTVPPNPSELLASQHTQALLEDLRSKYDVVLIDTSPLLPVTDAAAIAQFSDGAILVCRAMRTTRSQVTAASNALRSVDVELRGTVLTMVPQSADRLTGYGSSYSVDTSLPSKIQAPSSGRARRPSHAPARIDVPTERVQVRGQRPLRNGERATFPGRAASAEPEAPPPPFRIGPDGTSQNQ